MYKGNEYESDGMSMSLLTWVWWNEYESDGMSMSLLTWVPSLQF